MDRSGSASTIARRSSPRRDRDTRRMVRRLGLAGAILAGVASAALIPLGAAYLAGGSWAGATDPTLTGMVLESPAGDSLGAHLAGLAVVSAFFIAGKAPRFVAIAGAGIVCASFAFRGHVLTEPRASRSAGDCASAGPRVLDRCIRAVASDGGPRRPDARRGSRGRVWRRVARSSKVEPVAHGNDMLLAKLFTLSSCVLCLNWNRASAPRLWRASGGGARCPAGVA